MNEKLKASILETYSYLFSTNINDLKIKINEEILSLTSHDKISVTSISSSETKTYKNIVFFLSTLLILTTVFNVKTIKQYDIEIPITDKFIYICVIGLFITTAIYWNKFKIDYWHQNTRSMALASKTKNTFEYYVNNIDKYIISRNQFLIFTNKLLELNSDSLLEIDVCLDNLSHIYDLKETAQTIKECKEISKKSIIPNSSFTPRIRDTENQETMKFIKELTDKSNSLHSELELDTYALRQCINEENHNKYLKLKKLVYLHKAHLLPWTKTHKQICDERYPEKIILTELNEVVVKLDFIKNYIVALPKITSKNLFIERNIPMAVSIFAISLKLLFPFIFQFYL